MHSNCNGPFDGGGRLCALCLSHPTETLKPCVRLVAESATMRALLERAVPVAASDAPVVILGETGSGKEVLARVLHASSPRASGAFVAVNCGAMPAELVESEFFGHVRGAFSGAVAEKRGLFEEAAGGTILLDEIAELPLPMQVKLLRVLQDGEVRRVGANRSSAVDVRVIAATHRDLGFLVKAGTLPGGPVLPAQGVHLPAPPAARTDRGHPAAGHRHPRPPARERRPLQPGRRARPPRSPLAGKRAGAGERRPARGRHGPWRPDRAGGPSRRGAPARAALAPSVALRARRPPRVSSRSPWSSGATSSRWSRACGGNQAEAARVLGIARNTLWRKLEAYHREGDPDAAPQAAGW